MSHLQPSSCYMPDLGEYNDFRGKVTPVSYHQSSDRESLFQLAGNIKRHITQQMADPEEQETVVKKYHPGIGPSTWEDINVVYAMRVFFHPLGDLDKVLPLQCEPSNAELSKFQDLLDSSMDESFFRDHSRWTHVKDRSLRILVAKIALLIRGETLAEESKAEAYSGAVFRALANYLGADDPDYSSVVLEENFNLKTTFGAYEFHTKVEFALTTWKYFNQGRAFAFIEDKKFQGPSPQRSLAQKVGDSLAFANANFVEDEAPHDQQVFGVAVRHRFFTFWHGVFPSNYIEAIRADPGALKGEYALLKCFPESNFGLDICNPVDRLVIVRGMLRMMKYIEKEFTL